MGTVGNWPHLGSIEGAGGAEGSAAGVGMKRQGSASSSGGSGTGKRPRRVTPTQVPPRSPLSYASFCSATKPSVSEVRPWLKGRVWLLLMLSPQ